MKFNEIILELTVKDIERIKDFYIEILQFKIEHERLIDKFVFFRLRIFNGNYRSESVYDDRRSYDI